MKNKKGVTLGRILLYILFISLLGFFIYIIACTFKAIKDKQLTCTNTHEVIKKSYNNAFDYSATDYYVRSYINFYSTSNIALDAYGNTFPSSSLGNIATIYPPTSSNMVTGFITCSQGRPSNVTFNYGNYNDEVLHLGSIMKDLYYNSTQATYEWNNGDIDYPIDLFDTFTNNSACIVLEFNNLPIEIFNFNFTGTINTNSSAFYVTGSSTNNSASYFCQFLSNNGTGRFTYDMLPSSFRSNYSSISKVIIPVYQSANSNEGGWYLPYRQYNYNYNQVITTPSFAIDFTFDIYTASQDEQDAYQAGYQAGLVAGDSALRDYNAELITQVNTLENQLDDVKSRVNQQSEIITQLNNQLQQSNNNFKGLFFTFADIPFKTVSNALGFEFWGVNLFRFFVGIITALGIVWLIKRII